MAIHDHHVRAALDDAREAAGRLAGSANPGERAQLVHDTYRHVETALQRLAGTTALSGQALLKEVRQRNLLTLAQAHAVIDLGALAERAATPHYTVSDGDVRQVVGGLEQLLAGGDPPRPSGTPPVAAAAPATASTPAAPVPPRNVLGRALVAVALLAVVGAAGWGLYAWQREPADLRRGRAAYAAGDRLTARNAFSALTGREPAMAEPYIYLGRIAREEGDLASAREYLRKAVALAPGNYLTHRELAAVLLASGRPDLARSFYERAIRLNPADTTALGYMGCTMARLGRPDMAQRFLARAGSGAWVQCAAMSPPLPAPVAPPGLRP